ncbi:MAG: CDP-alcohol phosphatidyltransferase family protein [Bacteroidia bacterium]|nr:CDP-alcohol phosphatidyltransferase family protein [Bacteroidia bacterium]
MLAAAACMAAGLPGWLLSAAAAASLAGWGYAAYAGWLPERRWHLGSAANLVTAFRWLAVALLAALFPALTPWQTGLWAWGIFLADGLDGWLARRLGQASLAGEYLDKETDALFVLTMGLLLYLSSRAGGWVLIPGALRYLYVLALIRWKPDTRKEPRFRFGRYAAGLLMAALSTVWLLPDAWALPLLAPAVLLTVASFGVSIVSLRRIARL